MKKTELVEKIAKDAKITKAAAQKALDSFIDGVKKSLKKGEKVTLSGFGTFSVLPTGKGGSGTKPPTGTEIIDKQIRRLLEEKFAPLKSEIDDLKQKVSLIRTEVEAVMAAIEQERERLGGNAKDVEAPSNSFSV